jgi:urease beta subunit
MIPGERQLRDEDIELNEGRDITLIPFSGDRKVYGFRGDVMGELKGAD